MTLHRLKTAFVLGVALLVSGCWQSPSPLITDAQADKVKLAKFYDTVVSAAATPTRYRMEKNGKGWKAFKQEGAGKPETVYRLTFDALFDKFYLVQIMDSADEKVDSYRVFDLSKKGEMTSWSPACGKGEQGVTYVKAEGATCTFNSYDALRTRALARATQISKGDVDGGSKDATYKAAKK